MACPIARARSRGLSLLRAHPLRGLLSTWPRPAPEGHAGDAVWGMRRSCGCARAFVAAACLFIPFFHASGYPGGRAHSVCACFPARAPRRWRCSAAWGFASLRCAVPLLFECARGRLVPRTSKNGERVGGVGRYARLATRRIRTAVLRSCVAVSSARRAERCGARNVPRARHCVGLSRGAAASQCSYGARTAAGV